MTRITVTNVPEVEVARLREELELVDRLQEARSSRISFLEDQLRSAQYALVASLSFNAVLGILFLITL